MQQSFSNKQQRNFKNIIGINLSRLLLHTNKKQIAVSFPHGVANNDYRNGAVSCHILNLKPNMPKPIPNLTSVCILPLLPLTKWLACALTTLQPSAQKLIHTYCNYNVVQYDQQPQLSGTYSHRKKHFQEYLHCTSHFPCSPIKKDKNN